MANLCLYCETLLSNPPLGIWGLWVIALAETIFNRVLLSYWAFEISGSFKQVKRKKLMQNGSFLSSSIFNQQRLQDENFLSCGAGDQTWVLAHAWWAHPTLAAVWKWGISFDCGSASRLPSPHVWLLPMSLIPHHAPFSCPEGFKYLCCPCF